MQQGRGSSPSMITYIRAIRNAMQGFGAQDRWRRTTVTDPAAWEEAAKPSCARTPPKAEVKTQQTE